MLSKHPRFNNRTGIIWQENIHFTQNPPLFLHYTTFFISQNSHYDILLSYFFQLGGLSITDCARACRQHDRGFGTKTDEGETIVAW